MRDPRRMPSAHRPKPCCPLTRHAERRSENARFLERFLERLLGDLALRTDGLVSLVRDLRTTLAERKEAA